MRIFFAMLWAVSSIIAVQSDDPWISALGGLMIGATAGVVAVLTKEIWP